MDRVEELEIDGLTPSSTLLVAGPPMTGKLDLFLRLLAQTADRSILVSTKYGADGILERYRAVADEPDRVASVIDCVTDPESVGDLGGDVDVRYVGSARRLTPIGVEFTDLLGEAMSTTEPGTVGVGFHTLSTLIMQYEVNQVYQFLQVFFGQVRSADLFGIAAIDATVGTDDVTLLQHHFDGLVETREDTERGREYRVRGLTPTVSPWRPF